MKASTAREGPDRHWKPDAAIFDRCAAPLAEKDGSFGKFYSIGEAPHSVIIRLFLHREWYGQSPILLYMMMLIRSQENMAQASLKISNAIMNEIIGQSCHPRFALSGSDDGSSL